MNHMSIFPGAYAAEALKGRLTVFSQSKGTIQFTLDNPVPEELIETMVVIRADDISGV